MDAETKPTQEELDAEQAALAEAKEEEVRGKIVEELGLDAVNDADKIDKLVQKELAHKAELSTAIKQKINWRTKVTTTPPAQKPEEKIPAKPVNSEDVETIVGRKVNEILQKRDLDATGYPDDLKGEIQRVAQIQGVSITQALQDPYVKSRIAAHEQAKATDAAAIGKTRGTGGTAGQKFTTEPPEVNMDSKEGRETWEAWKKWMKETGH